MHELVQIPGIYVRRFRRWGVATDRRPVRAHQCGGRQQADRLLSRAFHAKRRRSTRAASQLVQFVLNDPEACAPARRWPASVQTLRRIVVFAIARPHIGRVAHRRLVQGAALSRCVHENVGVHEGASARAGRLTIARVAPGSRHSSISARKPRAYSTCKSICRFFPDSSALLFFLLFRSSIFSIRAHSSVRLLR